MRASLSERKLFYGAVPPMFGQKGVWLGAFICVALLAMAPLVVLRWDLFSGGVDSPDHSLFRRALGVLLIWTVCQAALLFLSGILRFEIAAALRTHILQALESVPDVVSFSEKRRRMVRDLSTLEDWLSDKLPQYTYSLLTLALTLGLWFWMSAALAAKAGLVFLSWGICLTWMGRNRVARLRSSNAVISREAKLFSEVLRGARAVQSLFGIPFLLRRHEMLHQASRKVRFVRMAKSAATALMFYSLSAATSLLLWAWLMESLDSPTFEQRFFASLWCLLLFSAGWRMRYLTEETIQFGRCLRRVLRFSSAQELTLATSLPANVSERMVWGLAFSECLVRSGGRRVSVHNKIEIQRGAITFLLGPSGAGKSLVLEALCGLRPAKWSQLVFQDALGGQVQPFDGMRSIPKGLFSYVESEPFLIQGSIRENLTLGNSQRLSDMTLWQHLELVGLLPKVKALGGLNALLPRALGEFAESDRYRLALIRALLLDRPFLALDDPFRALDEQSWRRLVPLLKLQKEFSGILIACRQLPTRLAPDQVITLGGHSGSQPYTLPQQAPALSESVL